MTDTLTICARAMYAAWHNHGRRLVPPWETLSEIDRSWWIAIARAGLTELAENVSAEMVEAGARACADAVCTRWNAFDRVVSDDCKDDYRAGARESLAAMVRVAVGEG